MKKELRCKNKKCNKLLARATRNGILAAEVKCPRCKIITESRQNY